MGRQWFVQKNGKMYGPLETSRIRELAANSRISRFDLVRLGTGSWMAAGEVTELSSYFEVNTQPALPPNASVTADRLFRIITPLLEEDCKQFLILMHEHNLSFPYDPDGDESVGSSRLEYSVRNETNRYQGSGMFCPDELIEKLPDAGMFERGVQGRMKLTTLGRAYAEWLIENDHKAEYFTCSFGAWGEKPLDWSESHDW